MNKIYFDQLYNLPTKERYLNNFNDKTKLAYERILKRASKIERKLNCDLYNFNLEQIKQLLYLLNSTVQSTVASSVNVVKNYIKWAIEQDLRTDNINPLDAVSTGDFYKKFVDVSENTFFSESEINQIVKKCVNYQDKAVIQGLFEGMNGRRYSELLNAKVEHIQVNDEIIEMELFEDSDSGIESRKIEISNDLYHILKEAALEEEYVKNNGLLKSYTRKATNELTKSEFILRTAVTTRATTKQGNVASGPLVIRRVEKMSDIYSLSKLTPTNIRKSGMLKMAKDLYLERGVLDRDEYNIICRHFNNGKPINGNYKYSRLKSDFLNIENIKLLYGLN